MTLNSEISWDYYRTFLGVLRHGSLSAAARELALTQPTIGRHIAALEQAIGFELFIRSPQGLLPTEAAIALKPYADNLAATTSALLRAASGEIDKVEGTVRISASDVIGIEILPPIITAIQEQFPRLEIELSLTDTVEDLLRRDVDIAIRMAEPSQNAVVMRYIGNFRVGFHASPSYLEKMGTPLSSADLAGHRLIGFDTRTPFIRAALQRVRNDMPAMPDFDQLSFGLRADSNLAQLAMMRAGAGIGMCQVGFARQDPKLQHILPDVNIALHTWVAMHENLRSSPRCRTVFDALVTGLKGFLKTADPDAPTLKR